MPIILKVSSKILQHCLTLAILVKVPISALTGSHSWAGDYLEETSERT